MSRKKPERSSQYWLFGIHPCQAALQNPDRSISAIWTVSEDHIPNSIPHPLSKLTKIVERRQLDGLFPPGTVHQGMAIQTQPLPDFSLEELSYSSDVNQVIVVLDQVTDPHNVGAILRSSAVFGAKAVLMTDRNAPTESGVLAKSASGALEKVPLIREVNLAKAIQSLKDMGFWVVGFSEHTDKSIHEVDLKGKIALVMGAEGEGVRRLTKEACDFFVSLPAAGDFTTLNVSNAAAIALYETFRQQQ